VVASIIFLSGALLWLFGRPATHIGASGLIYGLITYLIICGVREGRVVPLLTSLVVGFLYGGALLSGVLPTSTAHISWEGAFVWRRRRWRDCVLLTIDRNNATPSAISGSSSID